MAALEIGFVLFPNLTQLDLTGPLEILRRLPGAKINITAKTSAPVASDSGMCIVPTTTFADCGPLDLICVPGGPGIPDTLSDRATVDFVRRQSAGAKYVTSVCTGAFLLGIAGQLRGKKATTHWAYTSLLPLVGAIHEPGRVVRDGNLLTGGGVTAGIDFGLTVAAEIAGPDVAQAIQLSVEYDPAPPFRAGHPSLAPKAALDRVEARYKTAVTAYEAAIGQALAGQQA